MKVAICCHDGKDYFGGPLEWIKRFVLQLREEGCEVYVLFMLDHEPQYCPTYNYLKAKDIAVSYLLTNTFLGYHNNTEDRVLWFLKEVERINPDVYIGHNIYYSLLAGRWIKEWGIPTIMMIHSEDPSHEYFYTEFIEGKKEFAASGIVAVSSRLGEIVNARNSQRLPVRSIPCGVSLPMSNATIEDNGVDMIYLGKLTDSQKRITETAQAMCKASEVISECTGAIYGDGTEKEKVLSILQECKGGKVKYKGFVKNDDVYKVLIENNIFVLLSEFEGTPVALMEAMAAGLVPICYDIKSGIPELVTHMVTGLIVKDRDQGFVDAVKLLAEDHKLWRLLSENSINKVRGQFSIQATTADWIDFMKELVNEAGVKAIKIPAVIELPPLKPSLYSMDRRKVSDWQFLVNLGRRVFRLLIRKVLNR